MGHIWEALRPMEIIDILRLANPGQEGFEDEYRRLASSDSPCQAEMSKKMLQFVDRLRKGVIGPKLCCFKLANELCLQYHHASNTATIRAMVDYKDRSPLVDGIPVLHYRLAYSVESDDAEGMSETELRTHDVNEAYEFVLDAIRTSKRGY